MIPDIYPRRRPKAILFDWDNTLVDTWHTVFGALNSALEAVNRPLLSTEEFLRRPHHSMRDSSFELFGDHFQKGEQVFYESIDKFHLKSIKSLEGAEGLLNDLKNKGIYVGVVSNKDGHHLRKEVKYLQWDSFFSQVIGARDTEADKPSNIPVLAALKNSQVSPGHDVWFVGDSIVDVQCAQASGCVPVVVGGGEAAQQEHIVNAKNCFGLAQIIMSL